MDIIIMGYLCISFILFIIISLISGIFCGDVFLDEKVLLIIIFMPIILIIGIIYVIFKMIIEPIFNKLHTIINKIY